MSKPFYYKKLRSNQAGLWKGNVPLMNKLDMELTERCNNNCVHCCINLPANDRAAKERELSTDEVKTILTEAASLGCLSVRLTGGEPLLREDFEDVYLFARQLGLKVLLFTNATLITPHLTELFSRVPPLEKIEVTIYGMKKKSYEKASRISGSLEAAWRGISLLLEKKIPFIVKSALLPSNRGEIEEFRSWASNIPWMEYPPSYSLFFDLRCRRDSEEKNLIIKGLRLSPEDGLKIITGIQPEFSRDMKEFCSKFMYPLGDKIFSCGAGVGSGCVDAYSYFQPCLMLKHPNTSYDLKKGSLKDALTHFFPKVRDVKAKNQDYLARCARCFLKGLCEQCPAKSWMEHGTLDAPVEYLCEIAHTIAMYLGLLIEGERAWEVKNWRERIKRFSGRDSTPQKDQMEKTRICDS